MLKITWDISSVKLTTKEFQDLYIQSPKPDIKDKKNLPDGDSDMVKSYKIGLKKPNLSPW